MRAASKVVPAAIFCSDIHLSVKPPALRVEEPDWFAAMARPLRELRELKKKLNVPIICAGDINDKWNSPAELITFALQEFPDVIGIPGQHDLPNHVYEDIERTAYWTMVEAGIIRHLEPGVPLRTDKLELHGFPWGFNPEPCVSDSDLLKIAVVHQYCWTGKYKYINAPEESNAKNFKLSGYDAAVFGDNHMGFITGSICNCGGFMRRASPDMDRHPFVGILMSDGSIKKHILDTSDEVYTLGSEDTVEETHDSIELGEFTDGLLGLRDSKDLDFGQVVARYCQKKNVPDEVVLLINQAIEDESPK